MRRGVGVGGGPARGRGDGGQRPKILCSVSLSLLTCTMGAASTAGKEAWEALPWGGQLAQTAQILIIHENRRMVRAGSRRRHGNERGPLGPGSTLRAGRRGVGSRGQESQAEGSCRPERPPVPLSPARKAPWLRLLPEAPSHTHPCLALPLPSPVLGGTLGTDRRPSLPGALLRALRILLPQLRLRYQPGSWGRPAQKTFS